MKSKLIFFDIDGTLIDGRGLLLSSTKKALQKLKENGNQIFLATGRCKAEMPRHVLEIGFHGMVLGSGSYVEYEGEVLYHDIMDHHKVSELGEALAKQGHVMYSARTACYLSQETKDYFFELVKQDKQAAEFLEEFKAITRVFEAFPELENKEIEKINFHGYLGDINQLKERFSDYFHILPSSLLIHSNYSSGEITKSGINKASGIQHILNHLNEKKELVIAFGDGPNDVEMIQFAEVGVVMGNGLDMLKQHANLIAPRIEDEGVYKTLKELELI